MDEVLKMLRGAADGVFAVDQAQRIVFWNAAAERLLGYSAEEVRGQPCYEVFRGQARPGCVVCCTDCPVVVAARRGDTVPAYKLLTQTRGGRPLLLSVSVIVLPVSTPVLATIHLFRDITAQLQYETYVEQLLQAAAQLSSSRDCVGGGVPA
jgi:PAS domain-containing protein